MSSLEILGARVRAIAADLPRGEVTRAADHIETAHNGLAHAMRESVEEAGTAKLTVARDHLARALSHMGTACDRLDDYLASIGLATLGKVDAEAAAPQSVPTAAAPGSLDWWSQRINLISDGDATADSSEAPLTKLFSQLVELAGRGDRDAYRARLLSAGPGNGVKLCGLSWPMIRTLSSDILHGAPATSDDDKLIGFTREPVKRLLPKLPDGVMLAQLRGANSLPSEHRPNPSSGDPTQADGPHPADAAAVGPVLVSALLRAREQTRKET